MVYLKNFKRISTLLTFVTYLTFFQTVDSASEKDCGYFCNIQGSRYGNTISKNNGKTLLEHAKSLGSQYNYYMQCCDGVLRGHENVTIVSKDLKVLPNSTVKMKGEYSFMPIDRYCSTYCAHDLDNRITYFMYSENMTLEKFVDKYSADQYKNKYHLFTYCCDGTFTTDRMTYTRHKTQFSLHIPSFTIEKDSLSKVKTQLQNDLMNKSCSYYCNVKDKSIISIGKSNGKTIKEYAASMSNKNYDSFIKCCDGNVNKKSNVSVYKINNTISYYQNIGSQYIYKYYNEFNTECRYYCGFNINGKHYSVVSSQGQTVLEAAKTYKSVFDYMTFCCGGEKEIKGILVSVNINGEERAINTKEYTYQKVSKP
ncbi:hypothetical protein BCR36DRAFT_318562 [Piromyces finnis]|uniref:Uncharacterized protein n=1 Tax=Piromyces finnis TaxID=1754191 RepID=A0A1Y1VJU3_9FUNG|nr:hypothetical protein BCR36DRAFT_318562 [Piromyces finnis]|eukprot:ORX57765.1 hypothetical protein BCR36DRAFT_318562 [Piromyces finnis]